MSTAIVGPQETQQFEENLATFRELAQSIVVNDAESCLKAKTAQRDVRNYMRDVHYKLDPFVDNAKRGLDAAKQERDRWLSPAETIDSTLASKVQIYERNERIAAQREQDRINAEARKKAQEEADAKAKKAREDAEFDRLAKVAEIKKKLKAGEIGKREAARLLKLAGDEEGAAVQRAEAEAEEAKKAPAPEVKVAPNIPTVAGVPTSRRPWRWEVVDAERIPRCWLKLDELAINAEVRLRKDQTKIEGIRVYQEP